MCVRMVVSSVLVVLESNFDGCTAVDVHRKFSAGYGALEMVSEKFGRFTAGCSESVNNFVSYSIRFLLFGEIFRLLCRTNRSVLKIFREMMILYYSLMKSICAEMYKENK